MVPGSRSATCDGELAEKTAAELGGNCVAFELDVTDRESFSRFLDNAESELGPIDVVINNAGIMPVGTFAEESDETAKTMVDINLHGVIFGTKLALERMLPRGSGHIVNIASQAGKAGLPGGATYCATKHAVVGLSEAVRAREHRQGNRGLVRDAGGGQHRARQRPDRHARRQEARAGGGRRGDRRGDRDQPLRRLGAEVVGAGSR